MNHVHMQWPFLCVCTHSKWRAKVGARRPTYVYTHILQVGPLVRLAGHTAWILHGQPDRYKLLSHVYIITRDRVHTKLLRCDVDT